MKARFVFLVFLFLAVVPGEETALACSGRFLNPITDICWSCMFPMQVGGVPVGQGAPPHGPDADQAHGFVCACGSPIPKLGVPWGFWEVSHLADVVREPNCFPNLGGAVLNFQSTAGSPGSFLQLPPVGKLSGTVAGTRKAFFHVHLYHYPLNDILGGITSSTCGSSGAADIDIAYLTELDPSWNNDELALLLFPETHFFAQTTTALATSLACGVDCGLTTAGATEDALFWCMGCNGHLYPPVGSVTHTGDFQSTSLAVGRLMLKMHRTGLMLDETDASPAGLCGPLYWPFLQKTNYRLQLTQPVSTANNAWTLGKSSSIFNTQLLSLGQEHYGYAIWAKKNCCAGW